MRYYRRLFIHYVENGSAFSMVLVVGVGVGDCNGHRGCREKKMPKRRVSRAFPPFDSNSFLIFSLFSAKGEFSPESYHTPVPQNTLALEATEEV